MGWILCTPNNHLMRMPQKMSFLPQVIGIYRDPFCTWRSLLGGLCSCPIPLPVAIGSRSLDFYEIEPLHIDHYDKGMCTVTVPWDPIMNWHCKNIDKCVSNAKKYNIVSTSLILFCVFMCFQIQNNVHSWLLYCKISSPNLVQNPNNTHIIVLPRQVDNYFILPLLTKSRMKLFMCICM